MTAIVDIITDYSPPSASVGVPLASTITLTFDRLMDEDSLEQEFFISGPDTDQFIGPGIAEFTVYPDNVSQGDDFLTSPGYTGIVQGSFSFETLAGKTKMTFTPTNPMAALTEYTAHLPTVTDAGDIEYTGAVTFSWTTGSGSIEELPSTGSTSILFVSTPAVISDNTPLEVKKTTPINDAIDQDIDLSRITIEFNKEIESSSIQDDTIVIHGYPLVDHPLLQVGSNEDIAKIVTISGKKILIDI